MPWLIYTGFLIYLWGLYNTEIILLYALPRSIDLLDNSIYSEDNKDNNNYNNDDENKGDGTG